MNIQLQSHYFNSVWPIFIYSTDFRGHDEACGVLSCCCHLHSAGRYLQTFAHAEGCVLGCSPAGGTMLTCCVCPSDVSMKRLVFPTETSDSYVEMIPLKPLALTQFTLCMRVATELQGKREIILFAYRTQYFDALNFWRELDGRYMLWSSGF